MAKRRTVGKYREGGLLVYRTIGELVEDIARGNVPADVVSPGHAATLLGVTRQAVHQRLKLGSVLEGWSAEGVVLVDMRSVQRLLDLVKRAA